MNYALIYNKLIEKSRKRLPPQGYIEHHHIIPRCMNGSDDKENIAILTPEEHFIAHVLLVKIHPEHPGLIIAVARMCKGKGRKRRKLYGWLRRRHSEYMKERQSGANNSQHGTMWIHNQTLEVNTRINLSDPIPTGWCKGRVMNWEHRKSKIGRTKFRTPKQLFYDEKRKQIRAFLETNQHVTIAEVGRKFGASSSLVEKVFASLELKSSYKQRGGRKKHVVLTDRIGDALQKHITQFDSATRLQGL